MYPTMNEIKIVVYKLKSACIIKSRVNKCPPPNPPSCTTQKRHPNVHNAFKKSVINLSLIIVNLS